MLLGVKKPRGGMGVKPGGGREVDDMERGRTRGRGAGAGGWRGEKKEGERREDKWRRGEGWEGGGERREQRGRGGGESGAGGGRLREGRRKRAWERKERI